MGRIIVRRIRGMNWMAKVSLVLVFTLVFSTFMYQGWYRQQIAQAAASDVYLLWDGASGSPPAGWTYVATWNNSFIRGAATAGGTGGTATHTHTAGAITLGAAAVTGGAAGTGNPDSTHAHTVSTSSIGTGSNEPSNRTLVLIKRNAPATIPAGAIAMFDGTLPAGWTQYAAENGYYIKLSATAGTTGGNASNQHTHSVTFTTPIGNTNNSTITTSNKTSSATINHNHPLAAATSVVATYEPAYREAIFAKADADIALTSCNGLIALFDAAPPVNWASISGAGGAFENKFIKAAATYGGTGGGGTHTHTVTQTTGAPSATQNVSTNGGGGNATGTHTHTVDTTLQATTEADYTPPYINFIVGKYTAPAVAPTVTSPTATSVASTTATLGANVTSDGGAALIANGTCWGTAAAPTGNCVDEGTHTTGVFTHGRTALTEGSLLYYRGYADNSAGRGYSTDGTIYTEPTQPNTLGFTSVTSSGMTVNWVIGSTGNADNVIVLMKQGSAVDANPVDATTYTAAAAFGSGTQIGTGNYVVYKGTGTSVPVTALSASTTYYVKVYAFAAGGAGTENYNVTSPLAGSQATSGGAALPSTITSCAGCHAYSPTDGTQRNTPEGAVVGSHSEHSVPVVCSTCHVVPATETSVDFKHRSSFIQFQGAVGYSRGASFAQTNDLSGAGLGYCSTATCHNAYGSSGIATTTWGQNATCGSCHAIAGDGAPNTGSHSRHMSLGGALCNQCHTGAVKDTTGGTAHVDGDIDVAYDSYPTNRTKHLSGLGYSTCSNIYCHSNVQDGTAGTGPTSYGTPTWGGGALACSTASCHGNPPATPTNSAHTAHAGGTEGYSFACSTSCHNNAGDETTLHANGTLNMTINATLYGGTYSQGDHAPAPANTGYGTCSNVYCHGAFSGGLTASPAWTDASAACGSCHANTAASATSLRASHPRHAGSAAGGLSVPCENCHKNGTAYALDDGHVNSSVAWSLKISDSKFGASAKYNAAVSGTTGTKAPSASYKTCTTLYCHSSVQANGGTGAPAAYAAPIWGAASVTCASCHGQGTASASGQPSTGSHEVHVTTYAYTCAVCHSGHGEDVSTHTNGTINLAFDSTTAGATATYTKGTSFAPQSAAFSTCTTTKCHGDSTNTSADTGNWGTSLSAADACTVCHGTKTTAADGGAAAYLRAPGGNGTGVDTAGQTGAGDAQVGAHDTHLRSLNNYSSDIACTECHAVPVVSVTGIKSHLDGTPANMTWGTLANANSASSSWTSPNCTNTYCHFGKSIGLYSPATGSASVSWVNTAYLNGTVTLLGDCGKCHQSPPATTGAHNGVTLISQCTTCHTHVTAAGTFSDATKHINGAVEATGTCNGCHGRTTAGGGDLDNFAADSTKAMVNTDEWAALGHGRPTASGNYPGTNPNPPANFDGLAGSGQDSCLWCHDETPEHNITSINPYRLRNNNALGNGWNDNCLYCHDTNQTTASYKAVATFTTGINLASVQKIDKWHYGSQHGAGLAGGIFCWDCHDPHGDGTTGPIKMVQKYPTKTNTNTTYGVPTGANDIDEAVAIVFTNNNLGAGANGFAMTAGAFRQGICNACHTYKAADPNKMDNYTSTSYDGTHGTDVCTSCHKHNADTTNDGKAFEGAGTCIDCHTAAAGTRRAIKGEFSLTWGHKNSSRTGTYPLSNADCGVCHMEGNASDGSINLTYHGSTSGNGKIELRNPDTGAVMVTFNSAEKFSRNLNSNAIEPRTTEVQNFCLKCHDGDGALHASARVTGGTQYNPWNDTATVVNVDAHFLTTNATFHPVKGVQNNTYAASTTTMEVPWNSTTHYLITCFDCHAGNGVSGTQTSTVVAHGNAVTLRALYDRTADSPTALCIVCHKTTVYWTGTTAPTGSAFSTAATTSDTETHPNTAGTTSRHVVAETFFNGCIACHSSAGADAAQPARPRAAEDTHGYNTLAAGGNWATITPATAGAPPFAFFRATNAITSWRPKSWPGQAAPTAGSCNGTNMCGRGESTYAYQPGGAY